MSLNVNESTKSGINKNRHVNRKNINIDRLISIDTNTNLNTGRGTNANLTNDIHIYIYISIIMTVPRNQRPSYRPQIVGLLPRGHPQPGPAIHGNSQVHMYEKT